MRTGAYSVAVQLEEKWAFLQKTKIENGV